MQWDDNFWIYSLLNWVQWYGFWVVPIVITSCHVNILLPFCVLQWCFYQTDFLLANYYVLLFVHLFFVHVIAFLIAYIINLILILGHDHFCALDDHNISSSKHIWQIALGIITWYISLASKENSSLGFGCPNCTFISHNVIAWNK